MVKISMSGIDSGLDLKSMLEKIETVEKRSLEPISSSLDSCNTKLSAYGRLSHALETFQMATKSLINADNFNTTMIESRSTAFTATQHSSAVVGTYTLTVSQLATAQALRSSRYADATTPIASTDSTITIKLANGSQPITFKLAASDSSLIGIRDAINQSSANVTAAILRVSSDSYVLSVTAKETGTANTFNINVNGDSQLQNVLSMKTDGRSEGMTESILAANAKLTVNNIEIESHSNQLDDVIEGITLKLVKVTDGNQTLTIKKETSAILQAMKSWTAAFNTLQDTFSNLSKYPPVNVGKKQQNSRNGALAGDNTLRRIQTQLSNLLINMSSSSSFKCLRQIGITSNMSPSNNGQLQLDADKLNKELIKNANDIKEMMLGDGKTSGIATCIVSSVAQWIGDNGIIHTETSVVNKRKDELEHRYDILKTRIKTVMARYENQFSWLEKVKMQLNPIKNYLTQLFNINNQNNNN